MQDLILKEVGFSEMVMAIQGKALTTSLKIAEYFGMRHANVLRKIRQVRDECPTEFAQLNFESTDFIDKNSDSQPMFKLTKDGYMLVVMGFTGAAAMQIKIKYIQAFNWMADIIKQGAANLESERNAVMLEYLKEKDVASMSGRLLNRWGRVKKPVLLAKIERLEQQSQICLPGVSQ